MSVERRGHADAARGEGDDASYPAVEEIPEASMSSTRGEADAFEERICVFAPVLLLTVTVESRADHDAEVHVHCGGQGYWVARMARILGARPALCTVLGGETGQVFEALVDEGIELHRVWSAHPTAAYVHDRREGTRSEIVQTVPHPLDRHEGDELHNLALGQAAGTGMCVLAGTQEYDVVEPSEYERLASDVRALDARVIADITGELLRAALRSGLDLVKISDEELVADGWCERDDEDSIRRGIESLRAAGAHDVVVSRRENGVLAWYDGMLLRARAPELSVIDPRGAGDSMTAALAMACTRGLGAPDALRLATAAAAVNVTRHGLASGYADTILQLVPHVHVEQVG